jgi:hypothetical protein
MPRLVGGDRPYEATFFTADGRNIYLYQWVRGAYVVRRGDGSLAQDE